MKPQHLAFLMAINVVWGLNAVVSKFAVDAMGPLTSTFFRFAIILAVLVPFLRWQQGRMLMIFVTAFFGGALFLGCASLSYAVADNVSALAIVGQLGVPFSLILGVLFLGEKIHWPRMVGIFLSFSGVVLLGFDPALFDERLGLLLTVFSAVLWALSSLLFRQLRGIPAMVIYAWLAAFSAPILLMASVIFEPGELQHAAGLPLSTFGWVAFSALGSSIMGQGGMAWLLQRYPLSMISPLTLAAPLLAVVFATLVFHNPMTPRMIGGGVLMLAGIAIITIRSAQARERRGER